MKRPKLTRIEKIVNDYFQPYNGTVDYDDIPFIMEFLKLVIRRQRDISRNKD